jgi:hypothetical protein
MGRILVVSFGYNAMSKAAEGGPRVSGIGFGVCSFHADV